MTNLSPQAQAILHEFWDAPVSPARNVQIAAAIRAAAEQVVPTTIDPRLSTVRSDLMRIAAELEGGAALAQPELEGPTDEELWDLYQGLGRDFSPSEFAHAVLARWGRPAQLKPQEPGPDDVTQLYYKHGGGDGMYGGMGEVNFEEAVEEALARWGRPAQLKPLRLEPTDEELQKAADALRDEDDTLSLVEYARAILARWGRPAVEPVSERFEFSVLDCEHEEQAGGTAPTYSQALSEGQHYLAMYSQDGPHSLELRRVEVLPIPNQETGQ